MKSSKQDSVVKLMVLYLVGGIIYYCTELTWRGRSHPSMFVLGGLCFLLIGLINEDLPWEMALWKQQLIGTALVTALEFIFGIVVNIFLGWGVWDYSNLPLNLLGQICLPFSFLWFFVSGIAIVIDDFLRWVLFDEEKPRYKLF